MNTSTFRTPSAWLPVGMSIAALALVVGHAMMFGIVHETDEGTPAHLFQLLMVAQVPIIAYFAITWLPKAPRAVLGILTLQLTAALSAFAGVYWLT